MIINIKKYWNKKNKIMNDLKILGILLLNITLIAVVLFFIPFYFNLLNEFTYILTLGIFVLLIKLTSKNE